MSAPQSDAFKKAVIESKQITSKPSVDDLLRMYALYKIGTGEDIDEASKPGMFDMKAKAKYNAWKEVVDKENLTPEAAQEKYVELIESCKEKYGFDESKAPEAVGGSS